MSSLDGFAVELSSRIARAGGYCTVDQAKGIWGSPSPFWTSVPNDTILHWIESNQGPVCHAIGTNNVAGWQQYWEPLINVDLFDWIFDSSSMGLRKPDPEFWSYIEGRTGVRGDTMLLVDDRLSNVEAAINHGWHGIHFQDSRECVRLVEDWSRESAEGTMGS
ncbi:MAG: HAD family hydrolase [Pseudonocardiaceae bacterium]